MNKIISLLVQLLNIPLFLLSKLVPKSDNLWIFGAWFGEKYSDNPKYLFEYVNKIHPEVRCIWLSRSQKTVEMVRKLGYESYRTYSFRGYLFSARAKVSVICTGFNDVNKYIPQDFIINLWHGIPLKKILYDDKINNVHVNDFKTKLLKIFFPFRKSVSDASLVISSSIPESVNLSTAFKIYQDCIPVCGLPRNDVFFRKTQTNIRKKIIYMPTHRHEGEFDIFTFFSKELLSINQKLSELNIELYIKLHFYHANRAKEIDLTNVHVLNDDDIQQDIYTIINSFDMLITDYSSIYFDYLLSERPIIFAPFDINEYICKDREMYFDYDSVTPGPKCFNWDEILNWITAFNQNGELYSLERKKIKDMFHNYQDGKSSERVFNKVSSLI